MLKLIDYPLVSIIDQTFRLIVDTPLGKAPKICTILDDRIFERVLTLIKCEI